MMMMTTTSANDNDDKWQWVQMTMTTVSANDKDNTKRKQWWQSERKRQAQTTVSHSTNDEVRERLSANMMSTCPAKKGQLLEPTEVVPDGHTMTTMEIRMSTTNGGKKCMTMTAMMNEDEHSNNKRWWRLLRQRRPRPQTAKVNNYYNEQIANNDNQPWPQTENYNYSEQRKQQKWNQQQ